MSLQILTFLLYSAMEALKSTSNPDASGPMEASMQLVSLMASSSWVTAFRAASFPEKKINYF